MNAVNNNAASATAATAPLDIVIPKVSRYTSARYIAKVFYENKIAMARNIKFVPYKFARGDIYKRAIIQLACWFDSQVANNIIQKINSQNFARTIHKDENAWTLLVATEEDKNAKAEENMFFKIQNVPKYDMEFRGEVQESVTVFPVYPNDDYIQYVFYREPKLVGDDTDWSKKTPMDIILHFSRVYEVLEDEDAKIIEGLKQFMERRDKTNSYLNHKKYYRARMLVKQ